MKKSLSLLRLPNLLNRIHPRGHATFFSLLTRCYQRLAKGYREPRLLIYSLSCQRSPRTMHEFEEPKKDHLPHGPGKIPPQSLLSGPETHLRHRQCPEQAYRTLSCSSTPSTQFPPKTVSSHSTLAQAVPSARRFPQQELVSRPAI